MTDKPPARYLLQNGKFVAYQDARVHVLSTAFKYAAVVFEGFRAYWSEAQQELYGFRLHDHFERLLESMKICRMPSPYTVDEYVEQLVSLMRANDLRENLHMRVSAYVDADDGGLASNEPIGVVMAALPMPAFFDREGLSIQVSSWTRISDASLPPRVKAAPNYHNSRLALLQARADGYDDTVLLSAGGKVTEGPGYCVFMVRNGRLITPPVTAGILESITRDSLIQIAASEGQTVEEREIDRTELYVADELFFCGSAAEVTPILSVDRLPVGDGRAGPRTLALRAAFLAATHGEVPERSGWLTPVFGVRASAPEPVSTAAPAT